MRDNTVRRLSRFHRLVFKATAGLVGRRLVNNDMLLLTTTGRKTGRAHTVPLLYLTEKDSLIVIASYGGRDRHPDWYLNLTENPDVDVRTRYRRLRAVARTAMDAQRAKLWPRITTAYHGYEVYQARTNRPIPVVLLEPLERWRDPAIICKTGH